MSQIFIWSHNENIYDHGIPPEHISKHSVIFRSKYSDKIKEPKVLEQVNVTPTKKLLCTAFCNVAAHKTMGIPKAKESKPCEFLRKNEGIKWYKKKGHICYLPEPNVLPKIAPKCERIEKNFITKNIQIVNNLKVKRPKLMEYADTRESRTKHLVCKSGLQPGYVFSPVFGRTPKYIKRYKAAAKLQKQKDDEEYEKARKTIEGVTILTEQERYDLLTGLKTNWKELNLQFQKLPVSTDTQCKVFRKSRIEKELIQLERDILLVENNPRIFITTK